MIILHDYQFTGTSSIKKTHLPPSDWQIVQIRGVREVLPGIERKMLPVVTMVIVDDLWLIVDISILNS